MTFGLSYQEVRKIKCLRNGIPLNVLIMHFMCNSHAVKRSSVM